MAGGLEHEFGLSAQCCSEKALLVSYYEGGVLKLECSVCGRYVAEIQVAHKEEVSDEARAFGPHSKRRFKP
jgi:hypothetical protein